MWGRGGFLAEELPTTVHLWDLTTGKPLCQFPLPANPKGVPPCFAFSADGKVLASWGGDAAVRLWDVGTGRERGRLAVPATEGAQCLAWSADGKALAAAGKDGTVYVWQPPRGLPSHRLRGHRQGPFSLAFAPDGKLLASGGGARARLWDVAKGAELRPLPEQGGPVIAVAFSADGRALTAASGEGQGRVWDVSTGRERHRCAAAQQPDGRETDYHRMLLNLSSPPSRVPFCQTLALSANGTTLARLSAPNRILLCKVASGKASWPAADPALAGYPTLPSDAFAGCFAFSPDGKRLASFCADGRARLWEVAMRKELRRFEGHAGPLGRLAFCADGKTLISLAWAFPKGPFDPNGKETVHCWDVVTGKEARRFQIPRSVPYALSPDGKALATAATEEKEPFRWRRSDVLLWDLATGKVVRSFPGPDKHQVTSLAFSPDGKVLASAGLGTPTRLWDVVTGQALGQLSEPQWEGLEHKNYCCRVTFADGGQALVSARSVAGSGRTQVCEWDLATRRKRRPAQTIPDDLTVRAFSPDGKAVAFATASGAVRVWDLAAGRERCRFEGHQAQVLHLAFSPDGKALASGSLDGTIRFWDLPAPGQVGTQQPARPAPPH
jgi:WD40 repeat protein